MSRGDHTIGHSKQNLVLKTAGSIKVLVGDKYYNLKFRDEDESSTNKEEEDNNTEKEEDIIIVPTIDNLNYPGDGKVIMTLDGKIYFTSNGNFNNYLIQSNTFSNTVNFNNNIPFKVNSNNLITNLNANYLEGHTSDDFVLNENIVRLHHVIVDSIESSDGLLKYENEGWSFNQFIPDIHFLKNKVYIGKGVNIVKSEELEYSKILPYENTLLYDLLNVVDLMTETPYYYVSNLLNYDIDLSYISEMSFFDQVEELKKMSNVLFSTKESDLWNTEYLSYGNYFNLRDIKNNIVDINKLRFHKSSFILHVDNIDGLKIYDEFKVKIKSYYKTDLEGNIYDICYEGDSYLKYDISEINCIITKIDSKNNKVCITTDFETEMYNKSESYKGFIKYNDQKYEYTSYSTDLCGIYNELDNFIYSGNNIIGDISNESFNGKDLNNYGLLIKENGYISNSDIINCNVINDVTFVELNEGEDYYIQENFPGTYSFKSNGGRIILNDSNINGLVINIYAVDELVMKISGVDLMISAGTYYSYMNMPVSSNEYKWVNIK